MRVLLYVKMLKETEAEETILVFLTFLSFVAFQPGGGGGDGPPALPLATPMPTALANYRYLMLRLLSNNAYCKCKYTSTITTRIVIIALPNCAK